MATATTTESTKPSPAYYLQDEAQVRKVFQRFDTNRDGKISGDELAGVMKALGSDTSGDEVNRMMQEIDTDRDGFICLEEFAAFCKGDSIYVGSADDAGGVKELRDAFDLYDQDHDGFISVKELHQILNRLGERCSQDACATMIKSVDSDGDGSVSFEEFKKMMTNKPSN